MTTNTNRPFVLVGLLALSFIGLVAGSFTPKGNEGDFMLPGKWKFQTGDNAAYSQPGFDDSKWKAIPVGVGWEAAGYDAYDGIAWYRAKVVIPSSFKGKNPKSSALKIVLGKIDDADQTYVNGKLIGRLDDWQTEREYLIPADVIRWDQENTIAIRVDDLGGIGGMRAGPYAASTLRRRERRRRDSAVATQKCPLNGQTLPIWTEIDGNNGNLPWRWAMRRLYSDAGTGNAELP